VKKVVNRQQSTTNTATLEGEALGREQVEEQEVAATVPNSRQQHGFADMVISALPAQCPNNRFPAHPPALDAAALAKPRMRARSPPAATTQ
jgi:hypothetical protein